MKKKLILIIGLMISNLSGAQSLGLKGDFEEITAPLSEIAEFIKSEKLGLEAELVLKEAVLLGLKEASDFNRKAGINSDEGRYITIPAVIGSLFAAHVSYKIGNKAINAVTPEEQMSTFMDKYRYNNRMFKKNKAELYEMYSKQYWDPSLKDSTHMKQAINRRLDELSKLDAEKKSLLKIKPGKIYKAGRIARGVSKATLFIGAASLSVAVIADATLVWVPESSQKIIDELEQDVQRIKALVE